VPRLILMRHGNTFEEGQTPLQVGARTDLPLTEFGRGQAERMARFLQKEGWVPELVFAGPLRRQTESAEIVAKEFALPVCIDFRLNEIDYGSWEGLSPEAIAQKWPKEHASWNEGTWQGEIFGGTREGHIEAIEQWCFALKANVVFACTSNGLLRLFRNEKVKTGNYCVVDLIHGKLVIEQWNRQP
jgi:broad specificity phosphatase PhoE